MNFLSLDFICGKTLKILHVFAWRSQCLCSGYYYKAGDGNQLHLYFNNIREESLNLTLFHSQASLILCR